MLDDSDNEANRWTKPVVVVTPILSKGVHGPTAWLKKPRIKSWQLDVVARGEQVNSVWTPEVVQSLKNNIVEAVIVEINKLADTVRTDVQVPGYPLDLERNTMQEANSKNNEG